MLKGLLFSAHIDLSVIPNVPDSAEGLPDSSFVDERGERDSDVLAIRMGINRKMRRFLKTRRPGLVQLNVRREQRIRVFLSRMRAVLEQRTPIALHNDLYASWEAQAFSRILPGWEFMAKESPEAGLYAALQDEDRIRLRGWYDDSIALAKAFESRHEERGDKKDSPTDKQLDKIAEDAFCPVVCAVIALFDALDQWTEAAADRRVDLAEAAFAAFTLFGRNVLATCVMKTPALYDYFKHVRSENGENSQSPDAVSQAPQIKPPMSLDLLYAEIQQIALRGKADPSNVDYALAIEALLASHLPRLRLEKDHVDSEQTKRVVDAAIALLERIGAQYAPQYFKDAEFLKAFRSAWLLHLRELLRPPARSDELANACIARASQFLNTSNMADCAARTKDLQQCIDERTQLEIESTSSDFRRRAAIRRTVTEVEERIARLRRELEEVGELVVPSLLPEGMTLQALGENQVTSFDASAFDPISQTTLRSFEHAITQLSAQFGSAGRQSLDEGGADDSHTDEIGHQPEVLSLALSPEPGQAVSLPEKPLEASEAPLKVTEGGVIHATVQAEANTSSGEYSALAEVATTTAAESSVHSQIEELQVDVLLANPNDARLRLLKCRDLLPQVPPAPAENIALLWLAKGYPNLAAYALQVVSRVSWIEPVLDGRFVQAAIRGMHVWGGDQASLTRVHKDMSILTEEVVAECMERRPTGRLVPYLAFASAFQPTLFCGTLTSAHRLLESVATYFDGPTKRLVEELVAFASRNGRLDVDALQSTPRTADDREVRRAIAEKLRTWRDRVLNKQTGWAPSRKAIKECLQLPAFINVMDAVERDDASQRDEVAAFAEEFRFNDRQAELMDTAVAKTMGAGSRPPVIEGAARTWFLKTLNDLVGIVDEWLAQHAAAGLRSDEAVRFARRFSTMNQAAAKHLQQRAATASTFEQQVGLSFCATVLDQIQTVIEKQSASIWDHRRVDNWISWPAELMDDLGLEDNPVGQLEWLADNLVSALDLRTMMSEAIERKNFRHANLLLRSREDAGVDTTGERASLDLLFVEARRTLIQEADELRTLVDNAAVASLVDDARHYQLLAEIEHLKEALTELQMMDSIDSIRGELDRIAQELGKAFDWKIDELRKDLSALVDRARLAHGPNAVSAAWLGQVDSALVAKQTTVAEEMIDHLKTAIESGTPLEVDSGTGSSHFAEFLRSEAEVYRTIQGCPNPREIANHLKELPLIQALEGRVIPPAFKQAIEDVMQLQKGRFKHLEKQLYDAVSNTLGTLGLEVVSGSYSAGMERSLGFESHGRFCRMNLTVKRPEHVRGIRFFAEGPDRQGVTVVLGGDWSMDDLKKFLAEHHTTLPERTLLISGRPMSSDERNDFAAYCKKSSPPQTLYHLDPVMLVMLATLGVHESTRLKNFLQLTQPWTYANPYTGDQMRPAPPEMRYGRQNDVRALTQMHNGAAIIFGGRQLGKTTLLNEASRRFNRPDLGQHAFLRQMDGNLDRANLSGNELEKHRGKIWELIFAAMRERNLIREVAIKEEERKAGITPVDIQRAAVEEYFRRPNADAVMFCMDEMDRILGLDAANGFRIFRELSSLVNTSNGRFKVIIAGLENVRRFADAPNYPLAQLGSAIQVSIMSPLEAIQLVREPLALLGYEFESPLLINRVLVETNRHPGLIHFFCHKLLRHLASRHSQRVGMTRITAQDVTAISSDRNVREVISDRFEITLNLDQRYKVIAFSLIDHGTTRFSASRAKTIASYWAPEQFGPMSEVQFEAFLDELCGLGVLHNMHSTSSGKEYALRNANILNLMGGKQSVEGKLLKAIEEIMDDDPLSGHAFPEKSRHPSPLTLRDEKQLIGDSEAGSSNHGAVIVQSSVYSVALVTGAEALGLKSEWIAETLPLIGEEESPRPGLGARQVKYSVRLKTDKELVETADFKRLLNDSIIKKNALSNPEMLLIEVAGEMPISHTLDLLDIAHESRVLMSAKQHRVRVIFLLHPKAVWLWESNPSLTARRATQQPIIALGRWSRTAMTHFLNKLEFGNASTDVELLDQYSQGWYFSMKHLQEAHERRPEVGRLNDLGVQYSPMLRSTAKQFDAFLAKAGVRSVDWAEPLLRLLPSGDRFDKEVVEIGLMELRREIDADRVVSWLTALNLITPINDRGAAKYRVTAAVAAALAPSV